MYDTNNLDAVGKALLDLMSCMNSPRQDELLLREAGTSLDRALFPLLVYLSRATVLGVAELADMVGRDASTVSRQIAKLEELGLIKRKAGKEDQRVRHAAITKAGIRTVEAIVTARRQLLHQLLGDWSGEERKSLSTLMQKLADGMRAKQNL